MTLPISRDITLAPGTQVPSTLINVIQDMIIGAKQGPIEYLLYAANATMDNQSTVIDHDIGGVSGAVDFNAGFTPTGWWSMPIPNGARMIAWGFNVLHNVAEVMNGDLILVQPPLSAATTVPTATTPLPSALLGTHQTISEILPTPYPIAVEERVFIRCTPNVGTFGATVFFTKMTWELP